MRSIRFIVAVLLAGLCSISYCVENVIDLTHEVKNFTGWVLHSQDNHDLPFIIVDKKSATVFVFESDGGLYYATPALLGLTLGDDAFPGGGNKKLPDITLQEKTTQAGRFEASLGTDTHKSEILWIDYASALSLHPVVTSNHKERRLERLSSPNVRDRRITYGCVNVPEQFYREVIHPIFKGTTGIVYILPEVRTISTVFGPEAASVGLGVDVSVRE
jgi:hypothetical protein